MSISSLLHKVPVWSPFTRHWSDCPTYDTLDGSDCECYDRPVPTISAEQAVFASLSALVDLHNEGLLSDSAYDEQFAQVIRAYTNGRIFDLVTESPLCEEYPI